MLNEIFQTDGFLRTARAGLLGFLRYGSSEHFGAVEFVRVAHHVFRDQGLILLGERSDLFPIEPLFGDVSNVAQVSGAERGNGQQFAQERLGGIFRALERIKFYSGAVAAPARTFRLAQSPLDQRPLHARKTHVG